jgi:Bifunctional DNA primase/polymerase, N-terminal
LFEGESKLSSVDRFLGQPASPENLFGAEYERWQKYYATHGGLLPDAVWAALLMGRALIPLTWRKRPLIRWKAYQADPPTIEQVLAWQHQFQPPAWAVVTGRRYGIVVLDFDGSRGFETMRQLQLEPHVRTGSGGHHVYIEYPDDLDVRTWNGPKAKFLDKILPGTDIKSNGGYAAFAGASHKGSYEWLRQMWPDRCTSELHDLLAQVISASQKGASPVSNTNGDGRSDGHPLTVSTLLDWAWARAANGRNAAGFDLACQLRDNGYAQDESEALLAQYSQGVALNNQHGEYEPYTAAEALASVAQAYSRPAREPWILEGAVLQSSDPSSSSPPPTGLPLSAGNAEPSSSSPPPPGGPRLVVTGERQPGRRQIIYEPPLTSIVEASLDALDVQDHGVPQLFVRGNQLTEVVRDEQDRYHLRQASVESMTAHLDRAVAYVKRTRDGLRPIFPPALVVRQILARSADQLKFSPLVGIIKSPIMRADGTVLERGTPGYDRATRKYCAMDPTVASLGVPLLPTDADISSAVALLDEMICDVCFADPPGVYRANYFALLLTPLVRLMIDDNLPLFAIDATKPRSGKGLLAAIVGIVANGYPTPVTTGPEPNEGGEWRKKITTFLLAAETIVTIDNVVFNLNSAELCAVVTTRNYVDRILGSNTFMSADPLNSLWIFTGNGLQPVGDLVRRCFWIRLDPRRSDPEKRTGFKHEELLVWVSANRAALLRALLTLVRAWVVAGQPDPKGVVALGGFNRWVRIVGGILQYVGIDQFFQDPEHAYSDPDAEQWLPFLEVLADVTYGEAFTIADITKIVQDVQWVGGCNIPSDNAAKLRDHLPDEVAKDLNTAKFRSTLGYAFRKKKNSYYGPESIHLANTGKTNRNGAVLWQVRHGNQAQTYPASSPSSPSSCSSSTAATPVPPVIGTVRRISGKAYTFNGAKWVRQQ